MYVNVVHGALAKPVTSEGSASHPATEPISPGEKSHTTLSIRKSAMFAMAIFMAVTLLRGAGFPLSVKNRVIDD